MRFLYFPWGWACRLKFCDGIVKWNHVNLRLNKSQRTDDNNLHWKLYFDKIIFCSTFTLSKIILRIYGFHSANPKLRVLWPWTGPAIGSAIEAMVQPMKVGALRLVNGLNLLHLHTRVNLGLGEALEFFSTTLTIDLSNWLGIVHKWRLPRKGSREDRSDEKFYRFKKCWFRMAPFTILSLMVGRFCSNVNT